MFFNTDNFTVKIVSVLNTELDHCSMYFGPREFNTMSFRVKGDAYFISQNKTFHAKEGSIILIPPGVSYTRESKEGEVITVRFFSDEILTDKILIFNPENIQYFNRKFRELKEARDKRKIVSTHDCMSVLYRIFMKMEIEHKQKSPHQQAIISEIVDYINDHFSNCELTVNSLCKLFNMSDTYLRRIFVKNLGVTPIQYINNLRLSFSKELLLSGDYTIAEISEKCGFKTTSYFCTFFKNEMNCSPKNYSKNPIF